MRAKVFFLVAAIAGPAVAQEPTNASKEETRQHFRAGDAALDRGDYETAYQEFRAVIERHPSRSALANVGIAAVATARYLEGARYLHEYIATSQDPPEHLLVWYRQALERVGRVRFELNDKDARIFLDGKLIHTTPPLAFEWFEMPGEHVLRAEKQGSAAVERAIKFESGELRTEQVTFEVPQPVQPAFVTPTEVNSEHTTSPKAGEHASSAKLITLVSLGAATLISGTVTVVFALKGSAASASIADEERRLRAQNKPFACEPSCSLDGEYADRRDANRAANIGLVTTAGLGLATGLVYFLWQEPKRPQARVTPWIDGKSFGANWRISLQ